MKIENFNRVSVIVHRIKEYEELITALSYSSVTVIINQHGEGSRLMTIGIAKDCEHAMRQHAETFVDTLKSEYEAKIVKLKKELQDL